VDGSQELDTEKMLELGDKALYEAKRRGRDQAVHYSSMNSNNFTT